MRSLRTSGGATLVTAVGLIVLLVMALIVLTGHALNLTGDILLWVGLGICVVGGLDLITSRDG